MYLTFSQFNIYYPLTYAQSSIPPYALMALPPDVLTVFATLSRSILILNVAAVTYIVILHAFVRILPYVINHNLRGLFRPIDLRQLLFPRKPDVDCLTCARISQLAAQLMPYVPDTLIARIGGRTNEVYLPPEPVFIAIMTVQIVNFEKILAQLNTPALSCLLHNYIRVVSRILSEYGGIIDKIMGGGFLAIWPGSTACDKAVNAALDIHYLVDELCTCSAWTALDLPVFECQVAVHRGNVMQGSYGGAGRYSFTVIGDPVNTCTRVMALNDHYGTRTLISDSIRFGLTAMFLIRPLGQIPVRGRLAVVSVSEVICRQHEAHRHSRVLSALTNTIHDLIGSGAVTDAYRMSEHAIGIFPGDRVVQALRKAVRNDAPDLYSRPWEVTQIKWSRDN